MDAEAACILCNWVNDAFWPWGPFGAFGGAAAAAAAGGLFGGSGGLGDRYYNPDADPGADDDGADFTQRDRRRITSGPTPSIAASRAVLDWLRDTFGSEEPPPFVVPGGGTAGPMRF